MPERYWPLDRGRIVTSPFGPRGGGVHTGVDFGFPGGSASKPVYAIQGGTVQYVGAAQGYGGPDPAGWIVIDSDDSQGGGVLEYGHIVRLPHVKVGAKIAAGDQIATINPSQATNGGTAPHLHVSFMPGAYNPSQKQDVMPLLRDARDPAVTTVLASSKEPTVQRPDFNEYPVWSPNNSSRNGTKVDLFLLHTQEGDANADALARWLQQPSSGVSYHYTVSQDYRDNGVTVCDVVDTDKAAWAALSANNRAVHLVFAGSRASWTREQWMRQSRAIDVAAYLAVQDSKKYGFTPKVLSPPYNSNPPGISDHNYVTQWLKDGTHTDVGKFFPWDYFKERVAFYSGSPAKPAAPSKPSPVGPADDQLTMRWNCLGGQTVVEALAELRDKVLGTNDRNKTGVK